MLTTIFSERFMSEAPRGIDSPVKLGGRGKQQSSLCQRCRRHDWFYQRSNQSEEPGLFERSSSHGEKTKTVVEPVTMDTKGTEVDKVGDLGSLLMPEGN